LSSLHSIDNAPVPQTGIQTHTRLVFQVFIKTFETVLTLKMYICTHASLLPPIVQEAGYDPGPVGIDAENLIPTGIQHCPSHSESLDQICYPRPQHIVSSITIKCANLHTEIRGLTHNCNSHYTHKYITSPNIELKTDALVEVIL